MINKKITITVFIITCLLPFSGHVNGQRADLRREVTLYNPYKPSLMEVKKRSFLPDMTDTVKIRPEFSYDVSAVPFTPAYTISPIRAAALLPDPLPKLYRSFVNIGLGNYITPLAEISITNERSKKGTIGFYGRHFSTNGKVELQNGKKVFAGYMDNDASLFGRKFFRSFQIEGSVDYFHKTRYAYGYDPDIIDYSPDRKDIRMTYNNIGAIASVTSINLDSSKLSYDFDLHYDYFFSAKNLYQNSAGLNGIMAKRYKGFYIGSGLSYDFYRVSDLFLPEPKYISSISPFIKKSTSQWNFKLGFQALLDKNLSSPEFHIYPDIDFGFSVVPSYISFFTGLSGKLEKNEPIKIISENPFLVDDGSLFIIPNTDHSLIVSAGLKGNTGLGGNYIISASYSLINDMIFYANNVFTDPILLKGNGNYFSTFPYDAELLNVHAEMSSVINDKLSFNVMANMYNYTITGSDYAWNKPDWDGKLSVKYNLRNKILAGMDVTALGKRRLNINGDPVIYEIPAHVNVNLNAEYRYSKILSFWTRLDNLSFKRYYEWNFYPSQRFLLMVGFTYSL